MNSDSAPEIKDAFVFPASFAQQRLWFLDQLEPGNPFYNVAAAVHLRGPLDVAALERTLDEIVQRHETLRTTFAVSDGQPVQVIAPALRLALPVVDLRASPASEREAQARRLIAAEAERPFNLVTGPLFRALLLRLDQEEYVLSLTIHHIVSDGWSIGVLIRETTALYDAFSAGKPSPLPELPIQYADFALWQREWLHGPALRDQLDYWREQLAGASTLELPTDRPRPTIATYRGATQRFSLSPSLSEAIKRLGQSADATLFMTLLAAFQLLLHRYSGQDDIVVGSPIANRTRGEIEGLIGFFVNTLVLRTDMSGDPSFRELLRRVRATCLGAYAHQDLPFERLVEELQPDRDLSRTPLFQALFALQNAPAQPLQLHGMRFRPWAVESRSAKFDLTLSIEESSHGLVGSLEYNTDLFDPATIARLAGHFETLLEGIVGDPEQPISTLPLLTAAERRQILLDWNNTGAAADDDKCVHALFSAQVAQTPQVLAVIFEDQQLTYQALNQHANRLAHYLQQSGVGPDVLVGICLERSIELAVAVLAVLKAGGACLPLDPAYPKERLAFMLADAGAPVLLTQEPLRARLPEQRARVICLDSEGPAIARESDRNPPSRTSPEHIAYVIYTSGSTGTPKGAVLPHRTLRNLIAWQREQTGLSAAARTLQFSSLSFDVSFQELFATWCTGGTLVMLPEHVRRDADSLVQVLADQAIERLYVPFVALQQLADVIESREEPALSLKEIITAGEQVQLTPALIRLFDRLNDSRLHNHYGPSESHVVSAFTLAGAPEDWPALPPIGRPIANTQLYILDANLQPVPVGVTGELYIGGAGLARGYLGRPELTAERFIPNPFADYRLSDPDPAISNLQSPISNSERLYRTGDLARYLPDGTIEFLGRADQQVKIRGFRVEPEETAASLRQHPGVREAAVVAQDAAHTSSGKQLVAYVVPADRRTPAHDETDRGQLAADERQRAAELRAFLHERLPDYMLPAVFVFLEALPLTPSGKLDRRALPLADLTRPADNPFVAPRTSAEQQWAGLWAEALGLTQVGVHDNFFALGGHSLLATQIISRARELFQVDLPLRRLFETPTIAELAIAVAQLKSTQAAYTPFAALAPDPAAAGQPFPLTDVQQAYWLGRSAIFELGNVAPHVYLELDSDALDLEQFNWVCQRLVERHAMLRVIVLADGRQQILDDVPPYRIEVLDLSGQDAAAVTAQLAALREQMSHQVRPADRWPLFEVRATRLDDRRVRLHLSLDALIADAWSLHLLTQECQRLYRDPETALDPLDLSFRDYVLAEIALRDSEPYRSALAYWQSRLSTLPPAPELPLARAPGSLSHPHFVRRSGQLDADTWGRLKQRAAQAGVTPSVALLAAFAEVLTTWSKSPRFTINLTLFNRLPLHPQVNRIVGDFTSLTLLAIDNSSPAPFEIRARRRQEQLWEDLDHRYVSGVQVLRDLARARGTGPGAQMPIVFTSTLSLDRSSQEPAAISGDVVYGITQTPQVWLDHQVAEQAGALLFNWDAVDELFPSGLLDDMFDAYRCFLQRLADQEAAWQSPTRQLLPRAQLEQRAAINATAVPLSAELLHTLFAAQAAQRPEQIAVRAPDCTLTYAALYRRANQLGRYLRHRGASHNTLVAVVMEKGWEQVVAVLGVLQAGAAYLPIDPQLPAERLAYLLESGQVRLALTQSHIERRLAWPEHVQRVCLDDADLIGTDDQPVRPVQSPDDLAYVIYTSGSTGVPKGVAIDHRGAANTILDINQRFGVGPDDRVLALSSLTFDLSVYDIFGTLAAGATIVMPAAAAGRDPAHWAELVARERVTVWNSVPALMEMLVEYAGGRSSALLESLRLVMLSGDWIPVVLPDRIKALNGAAQVISLGGATEASIWSILYPIEQVAPDWPSIPYGKPMVNQQFHVLNEALEPCPIWVPGQLYIGGSGLAQGYLNRPDLTAERFIPNPYAIADVSETQHATRNTQNSRLYRTGDLGRYLPDGNIEFLGREDFQVKIQGYRIELGEIEAAVCQHPLVRAAVVTALGQERRKNRLVAYVVPATDGRRETPYETEQWQSATNDAELAKELRAFLKTKLPDYMQPAAFVILERLPLTPNGKVDQQALPAPEQVGPAQQELAAPRTPAEAALAQIWSQVLGLEQVGIDANFFELGGDSILAIQVITRANQAGLRLATAHLFQHQTIAELAAMVDSALAIAAEQNLVTGPVPLTPIQHWFFEQHLPEPQQFAQAVALELWHDLEPALVEQAIRQILEHHDALRMRFERDDTGWRQANAACDDHVPFRSADLSRLPAAEQRAALESLSAEMQASLNLTEGPLLRVAYCNLGPHQPSQLLFAIHHLVVDGVSWRIVLPDLELAYQQLSRGETARLPAKSTSFKQWATRLAEHAQSAALRAELAYWLGLASAQLPRLPVDYPLDRDSNSMSAVQRVSVALDPEETRRLIQEVPAAYRTDISAILLTGVLLAIAPWTGAARLLVDLEGHGREPLFADMDVSQTVGWFTALFPLLLESPEPAEPVQALRSIGAQLRAVPNHGIGYGLLRYLCADASVAEQLRAVPRAEVAINYLGQFDQAFLESTLFRSPRILNAPVDRLRGDRAHLLEISAHVRAGQLQISWSYSANVHRQTTIEQLARHCVDVLRSLLVGSPATEAQSAGQFDFPLALLDPDQLEQAFEQVEFNQE